MPKTKIPRSTGDTIRAVFAGEIEPRPDPERDRVTRQLTEEMCGTYAMDHMPNVGAEGPVRSEENRVEGVGGDRRSHLRSPHSRAHRRR